MVGDVNVLHLRGLHALLCFAEEIVDLILHLVALGHIADAKLSSMSHLNIIELHTVFELLKELGILLLLEEGRCCKLETPPWCVVLLECTPNISSVGIVDNLLVVIGLAESPGFVFVEAVIDDGTIGIGRVSIERLTLGIVEDKLLISVHHGNDARSANGTTFFGHEWLQTLEVVRLVHLGIVHVVVLVTILSERLMESLEWIVKHRFIELT